MNDCKIVEILRFNEISFLVRKILAIVIENIISRFL